MLRKRRQRRCEARAGSRPKNCRRFHLEPSFDQIAEILRNGLLRAYERNLALRDSALEPPKYLPITGINARLLTSLRVADVHVSLLSRGNATLPRRASEERAKTIIPGIRSSHLCLSAVVPALRRTGHPFAVSSLSTFTED